MRSRNGAILAGAVMSLLAVRPVGADTIAAYMDPTTVGNQIYLGALGQNFTVNSPITVDDLGVYNSGQTGTINGTLMVAIFSSSGAEVAGPLTFSGTEGTLMDGDLFLPLMTPVTLSPGDYSLTTVGWGHGDANGNAVAGGSFTPPILNTFDGAITFTGISFLDGSTTLEYLAPIAPFSADTFNAGSFLFEIPEPAPAIELALGLLLVLGPGLRRQFAR